jgi:hypothetical protein
MQRAMLAFFAICSSLVLGCGGGSSEVSAQLAKANKTKYQVKPEQAEQTTPESIAEHAESAHERAMYLKELARDAKFEPKSHLDMLKKYEADGNEEVADAAKVLMAKAQ